MHGHNPAAYSIHFFRAIALPALGDTADARSRVADLLRDLPRADPLETWTGSGLATALWQLGDRQGARAILERVPRGAMSWRLNLATLRPLDLIDPAQRRLYIGEPPAHPGHLPPNEASSATP